MNEDMIIEHTDCGFAVSGFRDIYGSECSIQDSSLAYPSALWLGVDTDFEGGKGSRMHLNQEQVAALIPLLQRFVDNGTIMT